ncbi:methyltransferase type 11 [Intrasporangium oryzae NRRL B-24470]|uniref:Methyltransferase type 11 n=1 Tax=Intrasporangium oryzae NRRL B-24470 TaxID=1386089 RepID=W9G5N6_9MICO|nr:methyltransferase domain-containing protein [Intrasporangium oryzae]EWT01345.1 methyltransferase type 11 [Intrasporangium oryzae NRRL B-24470]
METGEIEQAYSSLSHLYIDLFGSGQHEHHDDLRLIDDHLGHVAGPVLDLGCGPGHLTRYLRSRCPDVTGIDVVPEFISHARDAHPTASFELGSITNVTRADGSVAGALAWYSLIHFDPDQLDGALAEIRRIMAPGGVLVAGFFEGVDCEPFEHKVITAYRWPVDEFAHRLAEAGFSEVERLKRPQDGERRPHAAIAATAT